jgi:hypothetical protein
MVEELITAKLSPEKQDALAVYLKRRVSELKDSMKELYEQKITKWRMAYEARPAEEQRQFPFQNASNLIIPLIAIHTDTLHAQLMAAIFKTQPIIVAKILGDFGTESDELKEAYEEFMQYVAIEPSELDLYRVYNEGFRECIKYGTITFKSPWEHKTRSFLIPGGDGSGKPSDFLTKTLYEGPRPEKLPFDAFYYPVMAKTLEDMDIKCHKRIMLQHELEERKFTDVYDRKVVDEVLALPDRTSPSTVQSEKEETLGAKTTASYGHKEWDVWECYVTWRYNDESFAPRMIATYHEKSNKILRVVYDNFESEWFVGARMAHRDDMYPGYGFAEVLWMFQEGASETYNGYRDNQTVANTRVWRVHPDSKLHQGYRIYPSAMLPGEKDEIEPLAHGDVSQINLDELRLLLELAERRSGVSPPQQGMGAGGQTKRGIYSAMGTLSLLQEGNSRKDLNVSDMRDSHVRLMRLISLQYGKFGNDSKHHEGRLALFGKKAEKIKEALNLIATRRMGLPCYSSTASINKEVEKQNDMMLVQVMMRHYQTIAQLLGSMQSVMTPPAVKSYFIEVMIASNLLMKKMLRNFGHDEVDRLVPDPLKQGVPNASTTAQTGPQGAQPAGATAGALGAGPELAGRPGGTTLQ